MNYDQYCLEKVKASHSNFTVSFLLLSSNKRLAINALYAFCREVDDVADECKEYEVGKAKLEWWKAEIERLYNHNPQHPVTKALLPHIDTFNLNKEYFLEIIDGMEMDLNFNRYDSFKELQLYCYRVASVVGILSAKIFGFENNKTIKYAHNLGIALQLTNILRDLGEDARMGRIYVPLDILKKFNITENELLSYKKTSKMKELVDHLFAQALHFYKLAFDHLPPEDRKQQKPGIIMANIYYCLLHEIRNNQPENILNIKTLLPPLRKFFIVLATIMNIRIIR